MVIEDLISTGGSSLNAIKAVRNEGLTVEALLSIMTYSFKEAREKFTEANVKQESLCDLDTILHVASERQIINSTDIEKINLFRKSPKDWLQ